MYCPKLGHMSCWISSPDPDGWSYGVELYHSLGLLESWKYDSIPDPHYIPMSCQNQSISTENWKVITLAILVDLHKIIASIALRSQYTIVNATVQWNDIAARLENINERQEIRTLQTVFV